MLQHTTIVTLRERKMATEQLIALTLLLVFQLFQLTQGREFCNVGGYWCDTGHCCGNGECCTYCYELWWFWLVWFLIVFIIGFCVWQRKRFHPWRDTRCERTCSIQDLLRGNLRGFNFPDITPIPPCKLPTYAEIGDTVSFNTPPPPYTYFYLPSPTGIGPSTTVPFSSTAVQTCLPGSRSPSESSDNSNTPNAEVPPDTSGDRGGDHVVHEIQTSGNSSGDCQYCGQSPPPFHNSQQLSSSDEAPPTYTQVVQISPDNSQGILTPTSSLIRVVPVLVPPSPVRTPTENCATSVPNSPAAEHTALLSSGACSDSDSISDHVQNEPCGTLDGTACTEDSAPDSTQTPEVDPESPSDASSASSSTVVDMHVTPSGYSFVTRIR